MNRAARSTSRGRLLRRRSVLVLLVSGITAVMALLVLLACLPVREFTTPTTDEVSDRLARQFENRFVSELSRVRGVESPWAIRVRQDDLNAWFWNRLPTGRLTSMGAILLPPNRFCRRFSKPTAFD